MEEKQDIYENVPGKGKFLGDDTWWTNSSVQVGYICRSWMGTCKCIETAFLTESPSLDGGNYRQILSSTQPIKPI
jgi:hypothetical protein